MRRLAALALLFVGCGGQTGALVRFGRLPNPVLLGPVDRVGGGAPLSSRAVDKFDYVGVCAIGSHSTEDRIVRTTYTTHVWTPDSAAAVAAGQATAADPTLDIRITDVETYNWASVGGAVQKVFVRGNVVKVSGQTP